MSLEKKYANRELYLLEEKINYKFNSLALLLQALKHPSVTNEFTHLYSYEKLEFLGDKCLNLIIAEKLFQLFPNDDEGVLSLKLNFLISGEIISKIGKKICLGNFIEMSFSEKQTNGGNKKSNLENCMEALIGAVYLDGGLENARKVALFLWDDMIDDAENVKKDAKSQLQEWLQKNKYDLPQYILIERDGPDHDPVFKVELLAETLPKFEGMGKSLKEAQTKAAEFAVRYIENFDNA